MFVKSSPSEDEEDAYDLACVDKTRKEFNRTGEVVLWEQIKIANGL